MAQTRQPLPHALVENAPMQYTISSLSSAYSDASKIENNTDTLLSLFDSMYNINILLEKRYRALKMKNIALQIKLKEKEQRK